MIEELTLSNKKAAKKRKARKKIARVIHVPQQQSSLIFKSIKSILKIPFVKKIQTINNIPKIKKLWEMVASVLPIAPHTCCVPFKIGHLNAEMIIPTSSDYSASILYLHGGGFCLGSLATHRSFLSYLCELTNMRVLSIDYRLAPKYPYPAALEDALIAYQWLRQQEGDSFSYLAGDSAGGNLVLALLLALKENQIPLPDAAICFSPWVDLATYETQLDKKQSEELLLSETFLPTIARLYVKEDDLTHPFISPIYGDLSNLPPLFIQVASNELFLRDALLIFEKVKRAKGSITLEIWENMIHAWPYAAPLLPEARMSLVHVKKFITQLEKEHLASSH